VSHTANEQTVHTCAHVHTLQHCVANICNHVKPLYNVHTWHPGHLFITSRSTQKMHIHPRKHVRVTVQQLLRYANLGHCDQSCNLSSVQESATGRIHARSALSHKHHLIICLSNLFMVCTQSLATEPIRHEILFSLLFWHVYFYFQMDNLSKEKFNKKAALCKNNLISCLLEKSLVFKSHSLVCKRHTAKSITEKLWMHHTISLDKTFKGQKVTCKESCITEKPTQWTKIFLQD